ncbi:hypothetical protein JTE90_007775 [Oedothorax gibbosus]|uniref:Uncharacterized protein n=1 Tax=Oedothorax gibbosus TaxID=931172 RepID=A0AAV6TSB8_9ARAC|nr:hypothetical protein JTE90_007775 [Oedothorax gibbosus]
MVNVTPRIVTRHAQKVTLKDIPPDAAPPRVSLRPPRILPLLHDTTTNHECASPFQHPDPSPHPAGPLLPAGQPLLAAQLQARQKEAEEEEPRPRTAARHSR